MKDTNTDILNNPNILLLTVEQVSKILQLGRSTTYELVKSNSKILDRLSIPMYEKAVTESLLKNANNLHMITWGNKLTADNFMYITELLLKSEVPLKNFRDYVRLYKTVEEN